MINKELNNLSELMRTTADAISELSDSDASGQDKAKQAMDELQANFQPQFMDCIRNIKRLERYELKKNSQGS